MRQMEFKMERQGLLEEGQEVNVTESALPTSYYYTITPAVAMSRNYQAYERLQSRKGIVKEVKETPRGFYTVVEFDEDEPTCRESESGNRRGKPAESDAPPGAHFYSRQVGSSSSNSTTV